MEQDKKSTRKVHENNYENKKRNAKQLWKSTPNLPVDIQV